MTTCFVGTAASAKRFRLGMFQVEAGVAVPRVTATMGKPLVFNLGEIPFTLNVLCVSKSIKREVFKMNEFMMVNVVFNVSMNGSYANTDKKYFFLCYEEVAEGDVVVVDTVNGLQLATVVDKPSSMPGDLPRGRIKEVVCKVDLSAYQQRKAKAERRREVKREMDKRVEMLKEEAVYEMMAEKDSSLKLLLDEYKALQE